MIFIEALEISAEGKAFLSNILFDSKENCLPQDLIRNYLQGLINEWDSGNKLMRPEIFVRKYSIDLDRRNPAAFFCQGRKISSGSQDCSRVMDVQDLIVNNIDISKIGFAINGYVLNKQISQLEKFGLKNITIGDMRTDRSFAWVTKTKEIESIRKNHKHSLASRIRDKLGLLHFSKDNHLIEVIYPKKTLKNNLRIPTFIEGNPSLVYKSCHSSDMWGKTCDIQTYNEGCSEAVHSKVAFTGDFRVKNIGQIGPPTPSFNWEKFLATFPYKWNSSHKRGLRKYV